MAKTPISLYFLPPGINRVPQQAHEEDAAAPSFGPEAEEGRRCQDYVHHHQVHLAEGSGHLLPGPHPGW